MAKWSDSKVFRYNAKQSNLAARYTKLKVGSEHFNTYHVVTLSLLLVFYCKEYGMPDVHSRKQMTQSPDDFDFLKKK